MIGIPKFRTDDDMSLMGEPHRLAALICIVGFFLKVVLSDPLLEAMGVHYAGDVTGGQDTGGFIQKIHVGTYFIYLSFLVLLLDHGNPLRQIIAMVSQLPAFFTLFLIYILLFLYWVARDPSGVGVILDTHLPIPMAAIVLSYAPRSYCRRMVYLFVAVAVVNSLIGIAESIGRFRIFSFDPDWVVMKEEHFRSSALLGHPLNNAMFTSIAVFVALALRLPSVIKAATVLIYMVSLVAFGGRGALGFTIIGLMIWGAETVRTIFATQRLSMQQMFLLIAAVLIVPVAMTGGLFVLINSQMGERLAAMGSMQDDSAGARMLAFQAYHYMTPQEIMFGASIDRVAEITYRMGLNLPISDIENPWILMSMYLGAFLFFIWVGATIAFLWRLIRNTPLALKMAVLAYFMVASTSNSFGRKDATYMIMAGAVTAATSALRADRKPEPHSQTREISL